MNDKFFRTIPRNFAILFCFSVLVNFSVYGSPTVYDFDGDGKTDPVVQRGIFNGSYYALNWFILRSRDGFSATIWGKSENLLTDIPQMGDYDGDGKWDVTVWRYDLRNTTVQPAYWYVLRSSDNAFQSVQWGSTYDRQIPQDDDGDGKGREYTVGTVELLPQSENIYVAMREGWHSLEMAPEDPAREWQWMKKTGTLAFRNPKQNVTLYLETDGRPDLFPNAPQVISVIVNGAVAHQFKIDQKDPILRRLPLTAAQLGTGDTVEITLDADKAFVPAQMPGVGGDPRELSMRVYHAFIEPAK